MYLNRLFLLFLFGCAAATPAFSQKSNTPKIIKTALEKSAAKNAPKSAQGIIKSNISHKKFPNKKISLDPTVLKLLTIQTKNAATAHYKDVMLFRLYDKEYGIVPAVNDFMHELIKNTEIVQHGPISSSQPNLSSKAPQEAFAPIDVRNRLLQAEQRFQKAEKNWKAVKNKNFNISFFTLHYNEYDCKWWIEPYLLGEKDIIQVITFEYQDIRDLYNKMLAWAHGEEKFPFSFETVSQILGLNSYSNAEYDALYKALNSSGCAILRDWGWTDADIRQFIKVHQEAGQIDGTELYASRDISGLLEFAYHNMHLHQYTPSELEHLYKTFNSMELLGWRSKAWPDNTLRSIIKFYQNFSALGCPSDYQLRERLEHLRYYSTIWFKFWNFNIQKNQKEVLRVRQQLQENP